MDCFQNRNNWQKFWKLKTVFVHGGTRSAAGRVTNHPLKVRKWDLKSHFLKEYIDFSVLLCYNKSVISAINRNLGVMYIWKYLIED